MSRHIDNDSAIEAMNALAQATRLDAFRRLVRLYPDELTAGEIARQCDVPHNTMSTHLAILTRANLVAVRREGRMMHFRANLNGFQGLIGFLLKDCCQGRTDICAPIIADLTCCLPANGKEEKTDA